MDCYSHTSKPNISLLCSVTSKILHDSSEEKTECLTTLKSFLAFKMWKTNFSVTTVTGNLERLLPATRADLKALHLLQWMWRGAFSRYKAILRSNRDSFNPRKICPGTSCCTSTANDHFHLRNIRTNCAYFSSMGSAVFSKKSSLLTINFSVCEVLET